MIAGMMAGTNAVTAYPAAVLIFSLVTLVGFPATVMVVAVVGMFGFAGGFSVSLVGALLSALAAFLIARRFGRGPFSRWLEPNGRWQRIDAQVETHGALVVLLLRLLPSVPFALLNYGLGLTQVRFAPYAGATLVGILPRLLVYSYAAHHTLSPALAGQAPWEGPGFWAAVALLVLLAVGGRYRKQWFQMAGLAAPTAEGGGPAAISSGPQASS